MLRRTFLGLALMGCATGLAQDAAPAKGPERWERDIAKFEAEDREKAPQPGGMMFYGSSSIRLWDLDDGFPGVAAVNRGFGGCGLIDVAHFAERVVLPHRPQTLVIYAGENDLAGGATPDDVVGSFERLQAWLKEKLPETRVYFLSIKPSPLRWKQIDRQSEANERIAALCEKSSQIRFVETGRLLLRADGEPDPKWFQKDRLHLNRDGYALWEKRLRAVWLLDASRPSPSPTTSPSR